MPIDHDTCTFTYLLCQVFDESLEEPKVVKPKNINGTTKNVKGTKPEHIKLARAAAEQKLEKDNLHLFTKWSDWTRCTRCGSRGERTRHGQCTIKVIIINVSINIVI